MSRRRPLGIGVFALLLALAGCSGETPRGGEEGGRTPPPAFSSPASSATPPSPTSTVVPASVPIRSTFFGMHEGRVTLGVVPGAPVGALRFWDSATTWRDLELNPGQFSWSGLDAAVTAAESVHARPLLVLGQSPTFYASRPNQDAAKGPGAASMPDLSAWQRYVRAVAQRYGDRLDYQVWNEADVVGYWSGTSRQMAQLTVTAARVIHEVVPRATVVAPPFVLRLPSQQKAFKAFWSLQSHGVDLASAVDAVALNLYPPAQDPPEAEVPLFKHSRTVLQKLGVDLPIWNTEINYGLLGGPTPPAIPAERQRAYVMRTYLLNAGLGVPRVYWYRWDLAPIANTMLTAPDLSTPTSAGLAVATLRTWLLGASAQPCERSGRLWQCTATKGGRRMTFWWTQGGAPEVKRAPDGARSWVDADGNLTRCHGRCRVPVGQTPVMVVTGGRG